MIGIRDASSVPGFALFFTMLGFSALAKEGGLNFWMVTTTTLGVWGMPGQVALVSLYSTGAPLIVIFAAVALANMRMMLMVITGAGILRFDLHKIEFWRKLLLVQLMAITSWAQIGYVKDKYKKESLIFYYIGFSLTIYIFGILGTVIGYFVDIIASSNVLKVIMFMTPLYILLLVINSKDILNRTAVFFGAITVPIIYPVFGNWSILIGGVGGGSIALIIVLWWRTYVSS